MSILCFFIIDQRCLVGPCIQPGDSTAPLVVPIPTVRRMLCASVLRNAVYTFISPMFPCQQGRMWIPRTLKVKAISLDLYGSPCAFGRVDLSPLSEHGEAKLCAEPRSAGNARAGIDRGNPVPNQKLTLRRIHGQSTIHGLADVPLSSVVAVRSCRVEARDIHTQRQSGRQQVRHESLPIARTAG